MMILTSSVIERESANVTIVTESVTESVFAIAIAIVTEIAIGSCSCDEMKREVEMRLSS